MSDFLIRPGLRLGSYPQQLDIAANDFEIAVANWLKQRTEFFRRKRFTQGYIVDRVKHYEKSLADFDDLELDRVIEELRIELHSRGLREGLMIKAFAVIREAAWRVLGKKHFDVQIYGGWLIMNGQLAEMQTGEGKTLTTTLPACTAGLAGVPTHVITANDYLAERDCELLLPLYQRLGLAAGATIDGMSVDECRQVYQREIVHTTNKQVAFDYLRDRIEIGEDTGRLRFEYRQLQRRRGKNVSASLILRGLCFAIIDEADSVLIDEANTPLIITRPVPAEESADTYGDALYLASTLVADRDYRIDEKNRQANLTPSGEDKLTDQVLSLPKLWRNNRKREMLIRQALSAQHFYLRDRDYLVVDGKVQIVDQSTGRVMADRSWEQGLHQMIETKEGCKLSEQREPQARISYQKFFSRYLRIGGTSGTIHEVSQEMQRVYDLKVFEVSTNQPSKRLMIGEKVVASQSAKTRVMLKRVDELYRIGRPVLIGTSSVEESEAISQALSDAAIPHRVLNAKQDKQEAEIIAAAGQKFAITVATNMAGRGTDIGLGPGVEELGGLHVISLGMNDSYRVDRQLYGRSARQGDPGSAEAILSLQDKALVQYFPMPMIKFLSAFVDGDKHIPLWISRLILRLPQNHYEKKQRRIRSGLMKQDKQLRRVLAFAGRFE